MARIPESEIERLKLQVSVVRLVEAAGIALKPHGKDRVGRCPFHDDKTPSLVVSPKSNLWHCLGACQVGGSVIDWVMKFEGVSFRRAVELLRQEVGEVSAVPIATPAPRAPIAATDALLSAVDTGNAALLRRVIDHYQATLKQSPEALAYLDARGIYSVEAIARFKLGFANRTLGYQLPDKQLKAGAEVRGALQRIGILRESSGHEHFNGSLVVPVITPDDEIAEVYGRKITPKLRPGTPLHLYLPGPHRGVFNEQGLVGHEEAILCEALIDALTFWCAGYRNVTSTYGIEGFTDEIFDAFRRHGTQRVLIAYDADDAGNRAAEKLAERLLAAGIECYRCRFPKGMDANEYARSVKPAIKSLGVVIRKAEWMGKPQSDPPRPTSTSMLEVFPDDVGDVPQRAAAVVAPGILPLCMDAQVSSKAGAERRPPATLALPCASFAERGDAVPTVVDQSTRSLVDVPFLVAELAAPAHPATAPCVALPPASMPSPAPAALAHPCAAEAAKDEISLTSALPDDAQGSASVAGGRMPEAAPPAHRVPPSAPPLPVEIDDRELRLTLGDRTYTVRSIDKNLSYEQLKVWLRVTRGDFFHLDTVDLASNKQRQAWVKQASMELGLTEEIAKADLGKLLRAVEQRQDEIIRQQLKPGAHERVAPALSVEQHDAAMALLRDPNLVERIVADVEAIGVVGEASNALVAYLACVSRKLDKPLAILIQSTSAAGKSTLMDALLSLMPESERVHYSAMTGQSLFYLGEHSMKHKILAIAEEEGVRQAAYALKVLQSQGELTIASTGKDPATGDLQTKTYTVEGPVMLFLTTTAIDIDEELMNRCLVLTINESREQTAAIQARQRTSRTLAGLLTQARSDEVLATHRAAQQLLRPLAVVNPYAEQLTFASDRVRLRRDHQKYLALIDAVALLHQHQRPVRMAAHAGKTIEYIEVTLADIALANRLAHEVLGRSLDELPPQTRRVLGQVQAMVAQRAQDHACERSVVRFTRRELRTALGMSEKQLRVHVDRLVELDYAIPHAGRNGQRFVYELAFDGDVACDMPQAIGFIAVERLGDGVTTPHRDVPVLRAQDAQEQPANLVGVNANLVGGSWPARGDLVGTSWGQETPLNASAGAALPSLVAAVDPNALLESPRAKRRNGVSYAVQGCTSAAGAGDGMDAGGRATHGAVAGCAGAALAAPRS